MGAGLQFTCFAQGLGTELPQEPLQLALQQPITTQDKILARKQQRQVIHLQKATAHHECSFPRAHQGSTSHAQLRKARGRRGPAHAAI